VAGTPPPGEIAGAGLASHPPVVKFDVCDKSGEDGNANRDRDSPQHSRRFGVTHSSWWDGIASGWIVPDVGRYDSAGEGSGNHGARNN